MPGLYRGKVTLEAAEAEHLVGDLDFRDAATQDIRGAVQRVKSNSRKTGVIGFCMGGVLAIPAAVYVKEADAAVSWSVFDPKKRRTTPSAMKRVTTTTQRLPGWPGKEPLIFRAYISSHDLKDSMHPSNAESQPSVVPC